MLKESQYQKIILLLKTHPLSRFSAMDIAEALIRQYPKDYAERNSNRSLLKLVLEVADEIEMCKKQIRKACPHVLWRDVPRPRIYWYDPESTELEEQTSWEMCSLLNSSVRRLQFDSQLSDFLKAELNLFSQDITQERPKNISDYIMGNQWLHPNMVSMQLVDSDRSDTVRNSAEQKEGKKLRLWSFNIQKEVKTSNVREVFFQTVSNSSWANVGYLVTAIIADNNTYEELCLLSALHGIGVILLNLENPTESNILLPAKAKNEIDWQVVNEIVKQNKSFKNFIDVVSASWSN